VRQIRRGRVLYARPDGTFYVSQHLRIYRTADEGRTWEFVAALPRPFTRRLAESSRLACRLLRHEVRSLAVRSDGACVAANRHWIYYCPPGATAMRPSEIPVGDVPLMPPMCMTVGLDDRIVWGEYGFYKHRRPVRVYVSTDAGQSFELAHVFEPDTIYHVHNIVWDESLHRYWLLAGDLRHHPGIGLFSEDLADFEWVVKGRQQHRAVCAFDLGDRLVYGTDTETEPNAVMCLDKKTGQLERVFEVNGSCIYGCRFGGIYAISTTVEPSRVNRSQNAALWVSRDTEQWFKAYEAPKDRWNAKYLQFGSLVLPRGQSDREVVLFSGQALRGIDGKLLVGAVRTVTGESPVPQGRAKSRMLNAE